QGNHSRQCFLADCQFACRPWATYNRTLHRPGTGQRAFQSSWRTRCMQNDAAPLDVVPAEITSAAPWVSVAAAAAQAGAAARPAPVTESERIAALDVLRGFALLGILVMNVQSFAMIDSAYNNPTAYGDLSGANYAVWLLGHMLAELKFMAIFSMLFGAGIVLMTLRQEQAHGRSAALHYRRMAVLLAFGVLHAYLFWE